MEKRIAQNLYSVEVTLAEESILTEIFVSSESNKAVAIFPPDPALGGTMYTEPINKIFHTLRKKGINAMRMSFVKHVILNANYDKYIAQASVCLEEFFSYIDTENLKLFFVGYSFGALVALNMLLRRPESAGIVMIAPPLTCYENFNLNWVSPYKSVGALIYGTQDETIKITSNSNYKREDVMNKYAAFCKMNKIELDVIPIFGADHYFTNRLDVVTNETIKFITNN